MAKNSSQKKSKADLMDGAYFTFEQEKTPADFMDGPNGLRPGQSSKPSGSTLLPLNYGTKGKTIPPRSVWERGKWKEVNSDSDDWDVWVVPGEGTPGNYEKREYRLPESRCKEQMPKHPADWSKKEKDGTTNGWKGSSYGSYKDSSSSSSSSGLPFGLRVRCPNCGHFYSMSELPDHAKSACPASQTQPAMWVIECKCHPDDLQTAATILPGFPVKPVAPDKSGEDGSKDGKAEAEAEVKPKAGATT